MLTGFVLLITSNLPLAMPVSDRIYETRAACEHMKRRILERRPYAMLECGEVRR